MRTQVYRTVGNPGDFREKLLDWAQSFREIIFLDSNDYPQKYSSFDFLLAVDAFTSIQTDEHNAFDDLAQYQKGTGDWILGYLSYDLKNDAESLKSSNFDGLEFPDLFFFQPKKIFIGRGDRVEILYLKMCDDEIENDCNEIENFKSSASLSVGGITIHQRISKESYLEKAGKMLAHIYRGDIYEANLCMEFFAGDAAINPLETFRKLNAISSPPFAAFLRNNHYFGMSASPERYLRKDASRLISQPVKGTAKRDADLQQDEINKKELTKSAKERAENIMIVDLVRNDLSRTAAKDSVAVEELCGIYTFKQVHHLVSTITSDLDPEYSAVDAIKASFPMGSMTGAPKISAMNIIEALEETRRGLYSGAVGYFAPDGDFDFNVVIRSILYNASKKYISFSVGSAITAEANPESEYEECLLKAAAMRKVVSH